MSLARKTKMERLSEYEHFCAYRDQARRALVSFSLVSFTAGFMVSASLSVFLYKTMPATGNLERIASLPCQNTSLV